MIAGMNKRQGHLALGEIIANIFTDRTHIALIIQYIINYLKSHTQMPAIIGHRLGISRGQNSANLRRRFK